MEIQINSVEGKTKGAKSFRTLQLKEGTTENFFDSLCGKFTVWNCNQDWSRIGICRAGYMRFSYTSDFIISK